MADHDGHGGLDAGEIEDFIEDGYVRLDDAFDRETADEARAILWRDTGFDPQDRSSWTMPVVRLGHYDAPPFARAANAPRLLRAFDQLAGRGRWKPRGGLGTFPIRFPSPDDPGDAGWHIDVSFRDEDDDPDDFFGWRANVHTKGRALLMLFLFSDVGHDDAPTRIRAGSHKDIARRLEHAGEAGLTLRELAAGGFAETAHRREVLATGPAGTVYLCHPFIVHAAQPHSGRNPRFMAQPPLELTEPYPIDGPSSGAPVEEAIRRALRR
ncbi:phytanoyl-CoA dioxygenase family protein [Pararhizobium haloflavum]|uniref:phytanoyl-CoA dioxygenase family protein n=1 Tax=Pararhizobium haloflavum TaxID=2037914 RepID=UPI000C17BC54|nr:phytanoyl-CoA dioxygenase family protein [Pararhizobium haloflavum]